MAVINWTQYPIGHGYITSYQGPGTDTPHYADDVETPFHTPITALESGTIAQADYAIWSGQPGGGEVFVKPDDGSTEYYFYHLDDLYVQSGQHVQAGQVVGLSGGQNSGGDHNVSPMWSSGPHLHVGYFTNYISTPAGSRPYGPDITPLLSGGLVMGHATPLSNVGGIPTPFGTIGGVALPSADTLYRLGFVLLGVFFLLLGLKHFVDLPELPPISLDTAAETAALA
jgi:murein DD-endopeptidase MepM/ murein hydrolase activator NlpD